MKLSEELEILATAVLSHVENSRCAAASVKLENIAERLEELAEDAKGKDMGWISVESELPEASFDNLLLWNGRFLRIGICLGHAKDNSFKQFYDVHENKIYGITHWMPLPPAPEARQ